MMKVKVTIAVFYLIIIFSTFPSFAGENKKIDQEEYSITIEIREISSIERSMTKIGSKTYTYSDKSGKVLWQYTVYGKFVYNGKSAICTQSTDGYNFSASEWSLKTHSTAISGNKAVGNITAKQTIQGQIVNTVSSQVVLNCAGDGTLY